VRLKTGKKNPYLTLKQKIHYNLKGKQKDTNQLKTTIREERRNRQCSGGKWYLTKTSLK
jgi:hypothetical protein